jgi:prevent-host-death family protein
MLVKLVMFSMSARRKSTYNIAEAKARLPELVERASAGETIIVARAGKPKARLAPLNAGDPRLRVPGRGKGRFKAARDFDAPLPAQVLEMFEGKRR